MNDSLNFYNTGELYTRGVVLPLYLLDFTSNLDSEALMIALRRGWIQQEISYGLLHTETTKRFVEKCIESESFGELATFLRRRVKAMKWYTSPTIVSVIHITKT